MVRRLAIALALALFVLAAAPLEAAVTLVANAGTGNLTTAGTWGPVSISQTTDTSTTALTAGATYTYPTATFTITSGHVIDGVLLECWAVGAASGTFSVALSADSGTTATRSVTVNNTDLPATDQGFVFFKFTSAETSSGGSTYKIGVQRVTGASTVTCARSATTSDWTRYLRRSDTTAAPGATDITFIAKELSGATTSNAVTVTQDNNNTTSFGAMTIGFGGIVSYATGAATQFRTAGILTVGNGGTLNMGTSGTPMPRGTVAILEFDCSSDGQYGLVVQNQGTLNAYGQSRTSGKNLYWTPLNANVAAGGGSPQTLTVVDDTGWLTSDEVGIASTTQTASQYETRILNAGAGATSIQVTAAVTNAHSGTSPTQAEIILLTRDVKIRSASSTNVAYIDLQTTSTTVMQWVELRYLSTDVSNKYGLNVRTTTGTASITYSSMRDFESMVLQTVGAAWNNVTFSNNVSYNSGSVASNSCALNIIATTGTTWTVDSNIFIGCGGATNIGGVGLANLAGAFTNNHFASNTPNGAGSVIKISAQAQAGTFSGNVVHSAASLYALNLQSASNLNLGATTIWRTAGGSLVGAVHLSSTFNVVMSNFTLVGNLTSNINVDGPTGNITLLNLLSAGDTTFPTVNGIILGSVGQTHTDWVIENSTFSNVTGIYVAHTNDLNVAVTGYWKLALRNVLLGAATEIATITNLWYGSSISSEKHDQTAATHKTFYPIGTVAFETSTVHTTYGEKLTPTSATTTLKLKSGVHFTAVANGGTRTPCAWIRKDGTYNGNAPRLMVQSNTAIGVTADTVLGTFSAGTNTWQQVCGTTVSATDDGVFTFYVDGDGTAGNFFVADWTVS